MKILYFAWLRQHVGVSEETVDCPAGVETVAQLVHWLSGRGPGFARAFEDPARVRCAVNQAHVQPDSRVTNGDEVAFFSAGDGRMIRVCVQAEDFDAGTEVSRVELSGDSVGAVVSFVGIVRGESGGEKLLTLQLEHYPGMTERELTRIAREATARWQLSAVTIIHRVGVLRPKDQIVLVVTASSHRQAAFDGCAFVMDYLKTQAPFWKKEIRASGEYWIEARSSDDEAAARWDSV